ncbi:MAG TPA: IS110 family transposase [Candidatus Methylomirabilis sp.]|nr:IS110 family transposase [Candidatus Methylomirabilis sp.]
MDVILERCAGLDVHQATVTACLRLPDPGRTRTQIVQTFGATTPDLLTLRDWLAAHQVTHVAMESTGVYWKPVYYVLEDTFTLLLVNAAHMANVPGRKTDVADCVWIAQLLECGLLRGSFVPPPAIRELRDLTRYRKALLQDRTREANRLHKVLQDAGIKLATVATDILGVSGRAMLTALVAGTTDAAVLADLARGKLRAKLPALRQALTGRFRGHHAFLVTQLLAHLDYLDETITRLSDEIEGHLAPFAREVARVQTIPGGTQRTVENLLAEIGVVMTPFPTAGHLTSWAGMCPGNNESAGKRRRGRTRKGDRWLKLTLIEAALAAIRVKGSALGARYRRICRHRGHKIAIVAVARAILEIVWHILTSATTYHELGAAYLDRRDREQAARRYVRLLENLGHRVTLEPAPIAA